MNKTNFRADQEKIMAQQKEIALLARISELEVKVRALEEWKVQIEKNIQDIRIYIDYIEGMNGRV